MREIKFRAWIFEKKQMQKVYGLCWSEGDWQIEVLKDENQEIDDIIKNPEYFEFWTDKSEAILMQYTGLKDKNGKEIYEGDIVRTVMLDCQVLFGIPIIDDNEGYSDNQIAGFYLRGIVHEDRRERHMDGIEEVIGNIYENPELLKEK